jgi:hypothetical protein
MKAVPKLSIAILAASLVVADTSLAEQVDVNFSGGIVVNSRGDVVPFEGTLSYDTAMTPDGSPTTGSMGFIQWIYSGPIAQFVFEGDTYTSTKTYVTRSDFGQNFVAITFPPFPNSVGQYATLVMSDPTGLSISPDGSLPTMAQLFAFPDVELERTAGGSGAVTFSLPGTPAPSVPELSTWAMTILGFAGVGFVTYRRHKSAALAA